MLKSYPTFYSHLVIKSAHDFFSIIIIILMIINLFKRIKIFGLKIKLLKNLLKQFKN